MVAAVAASAGHPITCLVNNAGVGASLLPTEEMAEDAFRAVMETNYFGVLRLMQLVLPEMRVRGKGCIVNVSSVAGRIATICQGGYCASKFAVEALSESLSQEVAQFGIRVKIVEPGVVVTPILTKSPGTCLHSTFVVESLFVIDMYQIITIIAGGDGVCVVRV